MPYYLVNQEKTTYLSAVVEANDEKDAEVQYNKTSFLNIIEDDSEVSYDIRECDIDGNIIDYKEE